MRTLFLVSFADQIQGQMHHMDWKSLLLMIFIGAIAGMLAQFLVGTKSLPMAVTIIIGIIGGWLGDWLFATYLHFDINELFNIIIRATAGAMILVIILSLIFRMGRKDRTDYRA